LKLESLIKVALDELRMQMLGVQVLFRFQFQGIFQEGFDDVSVLGRRIDALGLALMVVVLGCLIAVRGGRRVHAFRDNRTRFRRCGGCGRRYWRIVIRHRGLVWTRVSPAPACYGHKY
jgi:hypothetical protein